MTLKSAPSSLALAALCAALAACGGSSSDSTAADPAFQAAAPSYDSVALEVDDSDQAAPSAVPPAGSSGQDLSAETCHPHLFARTREIVLMLNRHSYKLLHHVGDLIADHPHIKTGTTHEWDRTGLLGLQRKLTLTKNSDGSFAFEFDLAAANSTTFVKVLSGDLTHTAASTGVLAETQGQIVFDFDALHSVVPAEQAKGQVTFNFDHVVDPSKPAPGVKRTITIAFTNFEPEEGSPHGPRTGTYTHVGEPGVGGSLTFADSLILLCPANPNGLAADTNTVARWFHGTDGKLHGRADATAVNGQIPAGDTFVGVACHQGPAPTVANENGYWMMKLENSSGGTVAGSAYQTGDANAPSCDAAFGAVPSLTDDSTDYAFGSAVTFPGQW